MVFAAFLMNWLAVGFSWQRVKQITKPLAMIMVILWTLTAAGWKVDTLLLLLLLAQIFGLAGDVFLLLSSRWFLPGLGAFLMGHLFYISILGLCLLRGFSIAGIMSLWPFGFILSLIIWMVLLLSFYGFVAPKSPRLTMPRALWIPIQVYGWVLSVFVILSILVVLTAPDITIPRLFLVVGAFLFYMSDSLLAYDRFKRKLPKVNVWIMVTYHLAQFSLAMGFLACFGYSWGLFR